MKANKFIGLTALFMVLAIALSGMASAIALTIDQVKVEDTEVLTNQVNRLNLERNQEIEVRVKLTATADVKNAELAAFVSGYEYNDYDRISDSTHVFDAAGNTTYIKKLNLRLSDLVEKDNYKLRIIVSDRDGAELIQDYNLKFDVPRHSLKIEDVTMYPESGVKAGNALLTTVRVSNKGDKTEKDIKVTVSVPELGISGSDYIDELKSEDEKDTEEIYLRVPKCTKAGTYNTKVDVKFDNDHETAGKTMPLTVVEDDSCNAKAAVAVVVEQTPAAPVAQPSKVRGVLETVLLVLIGILVVIGLIIGFSRLSNKEE